VHPLECPNRVHVANRPGRLASGAPASDLPGTCLSFRGRRGGRRAWKSVLSWLMQRPNAGATTSRAGYLP
jgi:hypothetical protein